MNRTDFQQLAEVRIAEAAALLALPTPMPDGAWYLAGYAVECALKAYICKLNNAHDWPEKAFVLDCHTHDLEKLMRISRLETLRQTDSVARPVLHANWEIVAEWSEQSRYGRHDLASATALVNAIVDPNDGVLPWIMARW